MIDEDVILSHDASETTLVVDNGDERRGVANANHRRFTYSCCFIG